MIRFAYFDAGGTMLSPYPSVGAVYAAAGRAHGLGASAEELQHAFRKAWKRHAHTPAKMGHDDRAARAWWRVIVEDVFDEVVFAREKRDVCFNAFFDAFEKREAWKLHDDVIPTLEALRARGVRCGVLSNWDYRLRTLLATFDLTQHFDPILISAELGLAKPDPQIFTLACTRAGTTPAETLYIGDDPTLDLHPALSAGLRAYLIDRTGANADPRAITALTELSTLATQS